MKKIIVVLTTIMAILFSLAGCSPENNGGGSSTLPPDTNVTESKILIAYFTWADNTHVDNPDAVDKDASTSASVLAPGNVAIVASYIRDAVGGDTFSMVVSQPYSSNYNECLDRAADEKAANARPEIVNRVENMDEYDIIFLGYPNWWYSAPMTIFSFIESYDLSGKTIIPFCCHGTGGLASSVRDIANDLPSDVNFINNAFGVYRPDTVGCRPKVIEWLKSLGFEV